MQKGSPDKFQNPKTCPSSQTLRSFLYPGVTKDDYIGSEEIRTMEDQITERDEKDNPQDPKTTPPW